jgi:hypothetical protein
MRLSPRGSSVTIWTIAAAPDDDRWCWVWSRRWRLARKTELLRQSFHSDILSTTNPTWSNPSCRGRKLVTTLLSCGTAVRLDVAMKTEIIIQGIADPEPVLIWQQGKNFDMRQYGNWKRFGVPTDAEFYSPATNSSAGLPAHDRNVA